MTASDSPFVDALGRLTAPGHKDEFYDDLWRRIEREAGPQSESSSSPCRPVQGGGRLRDGCASRSWPPPLLPPPSLSPWSR